MPAGEGVLTAPLPTGEGPLGANIRTPGVPDCDGVLTAADEVGTLGVPVGAAPRRPLPAGDWALIWPPVPLETGLGPLVGAATG